MDKVKGKNPYRHYLQPYTLAEVVGTILKGNNKTLLSLPTLGCGEVGGVWFVILNLIQNLIF